MKNYVVYANTSRESLFFLKTLDAIGLSSIIEPLNIKDSSFVRKCMAMNIENYEDFSIPCVITCTDDYEQCIVYVNSTIFDWVAKMHSHLYSKKSEKTEHESNYEEFSSMGSVNKLNQEDLPMNIGVDSDKLPQNVRDFFKSDNFDSNKNKNDDVMQMHAKLAKSRQL